MLTHQALNYAYLYGDLRCEMLVCAAHACALGVSGCLVENSPTFELARRLYMLLWPADS
jgi:hypothetical protein